MKNKGFTTLCILFLLALFVDMYSTIVNKGLIEYLEANPLYKFGGLPLIFIINLGILAAYYFWYNKTKNPSTRFVIIFTFVAVILTRIVAIKSNFAIHQQYVADPELTLQLAKQVTQAEKVQTLKQLVIMNVFPIFSSLFTWLFFKPDHDISIREENQ